MLASNPQCIYNRICQWYETENQVPTPTRAEDENHNGFEPEQLTLISQKQRKRATGSRRLDATTHRESPDADSESFQTGSICQNGGNWTILH